MQDVAALFVWSFQGQDRRRLRGAGHACAGNASDVLIFLCPHVPARHHQQAEHLRRKKRKSDRLRSNYSSDCNGSLSAIGNGGRLPISPKKHAGI